mmetsp:Transcript_60376/g.95141  ORF Transcript_60376/g.95141 Transcript_60376/m.95141 type:complete len:251 (-) Transcript_60376:282-1034(-)
MLCAFQCFLLVVFVVPVRSYLFEKDFVRSETDMSERRSANSQDGFSSNGRHLNEQARDEQSDAENDGSEGNRIKKSETSYDKDDQASDDREGSMNTQRESRHEKDTHSREYSKMLDEKKETGHAEDYMQKDGGRAKRSRGKNCHGAGAKDEGPRNLRAHDEHEKEAASECDEEDNGFSLPIILGIVGAALVGLLALGACFFACSRRRTSSKADFGAGGVVVMGQSVTESAPKDDSNKKANAPEKLVHDNV